MIIYARSQLIIEFKPWKCDVQTHKGDIIKVYYRLAMPSNRQSGVTTANVTGMISYAHISDLSGISAYKSCFRLKEPELTVGVVRKQYSLFFLFDIPRDCVAVHGEK
ncbi:hypothetical protein HID58_041498 [Brassica napus]|uniref:Uncharacterized protein n=1 Tax=Brassica napus TaxID=3708 RepID=A0ABQ8BAZ7_BRANA|nr:hypothetical protein HID58_041498 [Brassica napus]